MLSRFEERKIQEKCGVKISSLKISLHVFFDKGLWLCIVSRKAAQVKKRAKTVCKMGKVEREQTLKATKPRKTSDSYTKWPHDTGQVTNLLNNSKCPWRGFFKKHAKDLSSQVSSLFSEAMSDESLDNIGQISGVVNLYISTENTANIVH